MPSWPKKILSSIAAALLTGLLMSCAGLPNSESQPTTDPGDGGAIEAWAAGGSKQDGAISTGWVRTFRDLDLESLVDEAIAHNRNLQVAAARLVQAHHDRVSARSRRLPSLGLRGSASRARDENGPNEDPTRQGSAGLSLDASWELDLWGRLRDLDHSAEADLVGAQADFRNARLSLAARTASAWIDLIAAEQQLQLAEETRDSFVRNHRITERNYKAGDQTTSPLSVQLGRTNIASAERSLVRTRLERDEAARSLEVLVGRYPTAELKGRLSLPDLPAHIPTGLPSDLLLRRPDLIAAAAALEASAGRARAARKDLLPSLNLSGGPSSSASGIGSILLDPEYFAWSVAASITQTVYEGGQPSAAVKSALAANKIALHSFADTALSAFREVESAIATGQSLAEQERFLETELTQANLAEDQAARDYSEGLVDIISLLEAQRRAANARIAMISIRAQRLRNRIDLHLALGGDFKTVAPVE